MTLVAEAQAESGDDSAAMDEIVRRFEGLAMKIARSLTDCPHLRQDLANAALIGLVKATRRHTLGMSGFIAFSMRYMTGAALRERKMWTTPTLREDAIGDEVEQGLPSTPAVEECTDLGTPWEVTREAVSTLNERQQDLLTLRYVADFDLADIAVIEGTSVSAVSQRLRTAHKAITLQIAV